MKLLNLRSKNAKTEKEEPDQTKKKKAHELAVYSIFQGIGPRELNLVRNLILERNFKPEEMIFKIDYPHTVLFLVKEGEISIFLEKDDKEIELIRKKSCDFLGEMGLFIETTRTASARAVVPTKLLAITKKDFNEFTEKYPKIANKILINFNRIFCETIVSSNERLKTSSNRHKANEK
ncbi:MAG: cyclic nucleotide-binding domain-containing protein [Candidatus Cloacimonetes bacterium]|nr:cyclic nucleotide-binding domain-containing protein [Candidatus Cloacimonadota bacterium]